MLLQLVVFLRDVIEEVEVEWSIQQVDKKQFLQGADMASFLHPVQDSHIDYC